MRLGDEMRFRAVVRSWDGSKVVTAEGEADTHEDAMERLTSGPFIEFLERYPEEWWVEPGQAGVVASVEQLAA